MDVHEIDVQFIAGNTQARVFMNRYRPEQHQHMNSSWHMNVHEHVHEQLMKR